jgi:hypothetical protein
MRRWVWIAAAPLFLLVLVVVATWPAALFAILGLWAESIPAPLGDTWDAPSPGFAARFPPGSSEQALLEWLRANRFRIAAGHAEREIQGPPCLNDASVIWTSASGKLTAASATLHQTCM